MARAPPPAKLRNPPNSRRDSRPRLSSGAKLRPYRHHCNACPHRFEGAWLQPRRSRHQIKRGLRAPATRIDEVVVTYFAKPHSYTTDDVVEISAHGSPVVLRHIVEMALARGARLAEPGEFTMRAFLNGRLDLTQAEAVRDLIDSQTLFQAKVAAQQLEGALSNRLQADQAETDRPDRPAGSRHRFRRRRCLRHARRARFSLASPHVDAPLQQLPPASPTARSSTKD